MKNNVILINTEDNVAVALQYLNRNQTIQIELKDEDSQFVLCDEIPQFHKVSIRNIHSGDDIIKYGNVIGKANVYIPKGSHVHTHNTISLRGEGISNDTKRL